MRLFDPSLIQIRNSNCWKCIIKKTGEIKPGISQLRICRPCPLSFDPVLWMMRNVLERMKNQFSGFYFPSYRENSSKIGLMTSHKWPKNDHNSKKYKSEKSEIWFFFRFSWLHIFQLNLNTFEEKKMGKKNVVQNVRTFLKKKNVNIFFCVQGLGIFFRIGGPKSEQVSINGIPEEARLQCFDRTSRSIFFSKVVKFTWKIRNRLNRKKNQMSDYSDFYFLSYGLFCSKNC